MTTPNANSGMDGAFDGIPPEVRRACEKAVRDHPELEQLSRQHFAELNVSFDDYSRKRRLSLGADVLTKTRVYLDQKYWIFCRDAMMGKPQKPIHADIWQSLCKLTEQKTVVCPVSYPVLTETFKQHDEKRRIATAECIDRLCMGVAIQPYDTLLEGELLHFMISRSFPTRKLYPLKQMVWNYASLVMGEQIPRSTFFDQQTSNALAKGLYDLIAVLPFATVVQWLPQPKLDTSQYERKWCDEVNDGAARHRHEVTSFKTVFMSEIAGALDVSDRCFRRVSRFMFENETKTQAPPIESPEVAEAARLKRNIVYYAFDEEKISVELPLIHIGAGIHAAIRHRKQPYQHGDIWDLKHAHSGLAYCDAFFTERNLGNLLTTKPLCYDKSYGCRVLWEEDAILEYLRELQRK